LEQPKLFKKNFNETVDSKSKKEPEKQKKFLEKKENKKNKKVLNALNQLTVTKKENTLILG